jgi:hypothetical protein
VDDGVLHGPQGLTFTALNWSARSSKPVARPEQPGYGQTQLLEEARRPAKR